MSLENDYKGFGDALINFLYSLAKSRTMKIWVGDKVSNYVLSQALIMSRVDQPGGLDKHEKGDYVEGYIAKAWIDNIITTDEAVTILVEKLKKYDLEEREQEGMVEAFRELLDYIRKKNH
ncbi:MAG: hypothetical protein HXS44_10515 [Theionarchaea archaeon]|nr:hypothetical protein [Theionarchaea archaeon]